VKTSIRNGILKCDLAPECYTSDDLTSFWSINTLILSLSQESDQDGARKLSYFSASCVFLEYASICGSQSSPLTGPPPVICCIRWFLNLLPPSICCMEWCFKRCFLPFFGPTQENVVEALLCDPMIKRFMTYVQKIKARLNSLCFSLFALVPESCTCGDSGRGCALQKIKAICSDFETGLWRAFQDELHLHQIWQLCF